MNWKSNNCLRQISQPWSTTTELKAIWEVLNIYLFMAYLFWYYLCHWRGFSWFKLILKFLLHSISTVTIIYNGREIFSSWQLAVFTYYLSCHVNVKPILTQPEDLGRWMLILQIKHEKQKTQFWSNLVAKCWNGQNELNIDGVGMSDVTEVWSKCYDLVNYLDWITELSLYIGLWRCPTSRLFNRENKYLCFYGAKQTEIQFTVDIKLSVFPGTI